MDSFVRDLMLDPHPKCYIQSPTRFRSRSLKGFYAMLARRPSRSCDFKVLNQILISDIIGFQLFRAKIQGTQQSSDLEVGCFEGTNMV